MSDKNIYYFLQNHGCEESIQIEDRIRDFKIKYPNERPLIVFNFNQMISILFRQTIFANQSIESICGGRERNMINLADDWFRKLIQLDCKLVFWCNGPLETENISSIIDNFYIKRNAITEIYSRLKIDNLPMLRRFPKILSIYFDGLMEVSKLYGEVYYSLQNKCNKDIANYATQNNALAVVAKNSDMIFYSGSWELWINYNSNSTFNAIMINKIKLIQKFKLNDLQMSLFAALYQTLTKETNYPYSVSIEQFHSIASFISINIKETKYCNILNDSVINPMVSYLENNKWALLEQNKKNELIKEIEIYNLEHMNVTNFKDLLWLKHHIMECGLELYAILNELDININLLCAHGVPHISTHLKHMKLRQIGLVRYSEWIKTNKKFHTIFHIFCNVYETFTEEPIYPLEPVPTISTILGYENQKLSIDQKLQIAIWVIFGEYASSQWSIDFVKDLKNIIDTTFFIPKLGLKFLLKNKIIIISEANILAISLKISESAKNQKYTKLPTMLHRRAIRLGHVYTFSISWISTTIKICGLSAYLNPGFYDGFIFHNIYNEHFQEI